MFEIPGNEIVNGIWRKKPYTYNEYADSYLCFNEAWKNSKLSVIILKNKILFINLNCLNNVDKATIIFQIILTIITQPRHCYKLYIKFFIGIRENE